MKDNPYKVLRETLGLSSSKMSELLGMFRNSYSRYERGIRHPRFEVMIKIANLCNLNDINFNELFGDK